MSGSNGSSENFEVVEKLVAGVQAFTAWGYSDLKVTQGGDIRFKRVPIKSIGLVDVMERFARQTPTPPRRLTLIKRDSEEGRVAHLTHDKLMIEEDFTDGGYKQQIRDYNMRSTYSLVLHGLAVDIVDERGEIVVQSNATRSATIVHDEDKAIQILKAQGLSNDHIDKLYADIRSLTRMEQERIDQD